MHNHTKQQLDTMANKYETFRQVVERTLGNFRHDSINKYQAQAEIEKLFNQALKSQAEYIRAEMVPKEEDYQCSCDGRGKDLGGYCDCGFSFNSCRQETIYNLNELINSFESNENNV